MTGMDQPIYTASRVYEYSLLHVFVCIMITLQCYSVLSITNSKEAAELTLTHDRCLLVTHGM